MAIALDTARMVRNMENATMDRKHAEAVAEACMSTYEAIGSNLATKSDLKATKSDLKAEITNSRVIGMRWTCYVAAGAVAVAVAAIKLIPPTW